MLKKIWLCIRKVFIQQYKPTPEQLKEMADRISDDRYTFMEQRGGTSF